MTNYAKGSNKFFARGTRVVVENPKNKHVDKRGIVKDLNRGNVHVRLDDGTDIVLRMAALRELTLLEKMAEAAK